VGHREPAAVRERAGRSGGRSERRRPQAPGSVPHEPAVRGKRLEGDCVTSRGRAQRGGHEDVCQIV